MGECIADLAGIYEQHHAVDVAREYGIGLSNAMVSYNQAMNSDKMAECLLKLKALYEAHRDREIAQNLSYGMRRMVITYGKAYKHGLIYDCLTYLQGLSEAHDDPSIREDLSRGLSNAAITYAKAGWYDNMTECVEGFKKLNGAHPDKAVERNLAIRLFNLRTIRLRSWKDYYDNLVLLYKLRGDLPDPDGEKAKAVEKLFVEETVKALESRKDITSENLGQKINAIAGDDVDVRPLIGEIMKKGTLLQP